MQVGQCNFQLEKSNFVCKLKEDKVFVEYFNEYLALPVFKQKIQWDQTSSFNYQPIKSSAGSKRLSRITSTRNSTRVLRCQSATCRHLMDWVVMKRLPYFRNSHMYREYKLFFGISTSSALEEAELDRNVEPETNGTLVEKSKSPETHERLHFQPALNEQTSLEEEERRDYQRSPKEEDLSEKNPETPDQQPSFNELKPQLEEPSTTEILESSDLETSKQQPTSDKEESIETEALPAIANKNINLSHTNKPIPKSCTSLPSLALMLKGVSDQERRKPRSYSEFDERFEWNNGRCSQNESGRTSVLEFHAEEVMSNGQKSDVENSGETTEAKRHFQNVSDLRKFIGFLQEIDTSKYLLHFWMDVEEYFDCLHSDALGIDFKAKRLKLFRFIQEHFSTNLTFTAKMFLTRSTTNQESSEEFFLQGQQDVFERLEKYWLSRYILHLKINSVGDSSNLSLDEKLTHTSLFPTLSFVKSFPLIGDDFKKEIRDKGFDQMVSFLNHQQQLDEETDDEENDGGSILIDSDMVSHALHLERNAGSPFARWLQSNHSEICSSLFFLLDFFDLLRDVEDTTDRLLNLCNVWKFFQKYCTYDSKVSGIRDENVEQIKQIHSELSTKRKITQHFLLGIFSNMQKNTLEILGPYWTEFFNQDVFVDQQEANIPRIDENAKYESEMSFLTDKQRRDEYGRNYFSAMTSVRPPGSGAPDRKSRLYTAITIAERCSSIRERRPFLPSLHRSSVKDLYEKKLLGDDEDSADNMEDETESDEEDEEDDFLDSIENTEMMSMFKTYIQDNEGRDMMNELLMYLEIDTYFSLFGPSKVHQRHSNAMAIFKIFFDTASRKAVELPQALLKTVKDERPSSGVLREAQQYVLPQLSTSYDSFVKYILPREKSTKNEKSAKDGKESTKKGEKGSGKRWKELSNAQLAVKDLKNKKKKVLEREAISSIRRENRSYFLQITSNIGQKVNQKIIDCFRKYLSKYEDSGFPRARKNLLFFIEVVKFKEVFPYMDERSLHKKAEVIVDVFLDSASPPWLQVDVSPEIASRVSQKVQHHSSGLKRDVTIFDESQNMVLKELLPFWNAFVKTIKNKESKIIMDTKLSATKAEKRQHKMYSNFVKFQERLDPVVVKEPNNNSINNYLSFSLLRGYEWKDTTARSRKTKSFLFRTQQGT